MRTDQAVFDLACEFVAGHREMAVADFLPRGDALGQDERLAQSMVTVLCRNAGGVPAAGVAAVWCISPTTLSACQARLTAWRTREIGNERCFLKLEAAFRRLLNETFGMTPATRVCALALDVITGRTGVSRAAMRGPSHKRKIVRPRQIACYLAVTAGGATTTQMAGFICRDHSTVIAAVRRIKGMRAGALMGPEIDAHVEAYEEALCGMPVEAVPTPAPKPVEPVIFDAAAAAADDHAPVTARLDDAEIAFGVRYLREEPFRNDVGERVYRTDEQIASMLGLDSLAAFEAQGRAA